ncbi:MAG TPA: 30S ribosomal protein S24e [Candidatus Nanopusillus sp.]|nr:30S ribosomal protein S24e [Candidatus Nanopusillus sp.]HIP90452.1 30S ribosomal protein S24e [Candidatus Nanopusillus sp.]
MEVKIIERNENKLLNREEIYAVVEHPNGATPKREEIRKRLAAMLGVTENLIVVQKILSMYGLPISRVWAHIYKDEAILKRLEPKYLLRRNKLLE